MEKTEEIKEEPKPQEPKPKEKKKPGRKKKVIPTMRFEVKEVNLLFD